MTKLIPILSGRCLVVELPEGAQGFGITDNNDLGWYIPIWNRRAQDWDWDGSVINLPPGNWRIIGMLSEVTEEQAAGMVEPNGNGDYRNYVGAWGGFATAVQSLESTIVSEGYGFDSEMEPSYSDCEQYENPIRTYEGRLREWNSRQSRVLDRSRCLLLGRIDG